MEFVEQLKAQVDIVGVVQQYVTLRKMGPSFKGLCPFHNEKTPSFTVHAAHQFYYCHGCHVGGDVLNFVMEIEHLSFSEALKLLAERHGIPLPKRTEHTDPETKLRAAVYQMHEIAEEEFRSLLEGPQGADARAYLLKRGVSPEMVEHFRLGYAARTLMKIFARHGFTTEQMEASGLVNKREDGSVYERFRNRLMFPIHNESGKTIGFGGRAISADDQPKYLNSPETPIYKKSHVLYNLHRAKEPIRKSERAVLVEGYMDVIGVYASGVHEVVASCGTALTRQQVQSIKRHSLNIAVNFDPDNAGANAAERSIEMLLDESMRIRIVQLEGGLDPDEFCKAHGADAYRASVQNAKSYFYWMADRARQKHDMRTSEGRVAAFQFLLPAIQGLSDKIERGAVANDVASYLGVSSGLVLENFRKMAIDRREKTVQPVRESMRAVDRMLIALLVSRPDAREMFIPELRGLGAVQQSPAYGIYDSIFKLHEGGVSFNFADLHGRLQPAEQAMLATALLRDDVDGPADEDDDQAALERGRACLDSMRHSGRDMEFARLKNLVKDAERAGNIAEAIRLTQELQAFKSV